MSTKSLTETLKDLGYTHKSIGRNGKHAIKRGAEVVFVGRAHEVWTWLKDTQNKGAKTMATKVEVLTNGKYLFEIWREAKGKYYANARVCGEDKWIYKWTSARTKKAVIQYIEDFGDF